MASGPGIGQMVIDLRAETAALRADLDKGARMVNAHAKRMQRSVSAIEAGFGRLGMMMRTAVLPTLSSGLILRAVANTGDMAANLQKAGVNLDRDIVLGAQRAQKAMEDAGIAAQSAFVVTIGTAVNLLEEFRIKSSQAVDSRPKWLLDLLQRARMLQHPVPPHPGPPPRSHLEWQAAMFAKSADLGPEMEIVTVQITQQEHALRMAAKSAMDYWEELSHVRDMGIEARFNAASMAESAKETANRAEEISEGFADAGASADYLARQAEIAAETYRQAEANTAAFAAIASNAFADVAVGTKSLRDALADIGRQLAHMIVQAYLFRAIMGGFGFPAPLPVTGVPQVNPDPTGGAGTFSAGPPELATTSGTGTASGPVAVSLNVDARGADPATGARLMRFFDAQRPLLVRDAVEAVTQARARGYRV